MAFEIDLPARLDVALLRGAGLETTAYLKHWMDGLSNRSPQRFEGTLPYFLSEPPVDVHVAVLERGKATRFRVDAPTSEVERALHAYLNRYSAANDGEAVVEREHERLWEAIHAILERSGISHERLTCGEDVLDRRAIDSLIELAGRCERTDVSNITDLFANGHVARADRGYGVRWLIEQFVSNPDPFDRAQLGLRIEENTVPAIAGDLIGLVENRKYGATRASLLVALARTKHPRAGDVIASVLEEQSVTRAAIEALGKLKAVAHADTVRRFLRHSNPDVRREARRTLRKLGVAVPDALPPPVHLVKGRRSVPKDLQEWSSNLDMEDLDPTLRRLASCLDVGFGPREVAEVVGVAEQMRAEQTKLFRFSVRVAGGSEELWLSVFMDDVDSPNLYIYASDGVIRRLGALTSTE